MLKLVNSLFLFGSLGLCFGQAPSRLTISIYGDRKELYVLDFSKTKTFDPKPLTGFGVGTAYQFMATTNGAVESWEWDIDWGFHKLFSQDMTYTFKQPGVFNVRCEATFGGEKLEAGVNLKVVSHTEANPSIVSVLSINNTDPVQVNQQTELSVTLISTVKESELGAHGSTVQVRLEITEDDSDVPSNVTYASLDCKGYKSDTTDNYKVHCQQDVGMKFPEKSLYSINATLEHRILQAGIIHTICVRDDLSCSPPGLTIQVPDPSKLPITYENASLLTFRQNDDIHLFASVFRESCLDENSESSFEFAWHLVRMSEVRRLTGTMTAQVLQDIHKVDLEIRGKIEIDKVADFYVPAHVLNLGSYLAVFAATESPYCGSSPVFSHDFVRIDVLPPVITAVISGGSYREWKPTLVNEDLKLDGSRSFPDDEHLTDDVYIAWICRLPSHRNLVDEISDWNDILKLKLQTTGGCFGEGFILKTKEGLSSPTSDVITIRGEKFTKDNEGFVFSLVVFRRSTKETSTYDQEVVRSYTTGKSVQVSINCVSNCRQTIVKDEALQLEATCLGCDGFGTTDVRWKLVNPSSKQRDEEIYTPIVKGNTSVITLPPDSIQKVGDYVAEAKVLEQLWPKSKTLATARYKFHVAAGPSTGLCEISPNTGVALITKFNIDCANFVDSNPPTIYTVLASQESRNSDKSKEVMLYQGMAKVINDIYLPSGQENFGHRVKVKITATNQIGRSSTVSYHVTVVPPFSTQFSSGIDTLVQGTQSTLAHLMKSGNVDGAVGIMFSVLETLDQNNTTDKADKAQATTAAIIGHLKSQPPKTAKNAFQFASALALATHPKFQDSTTLQNKRSVSNSVQDVVTAIVNTEAIRAKSNDANHYVEQALTFAVDAIGNAVTLSSPTPNPELQTDLLKTKKTVLREMSRHVTDDKVFSISDKERVEIVKSHRSSFSLGSVKLKDVGVAIDSNVAASQDIAVSTMYYNPYPVSGTNTAKGRSQLPVIGLSFLGNSSSKAASGRSRKPTTYDVFIPLRSSDKGKSHVTSTSLATVVLPPPCQDSENITRMPDDPVATLDATNECGAVVVKLNLSTELASGAGSSGARTYFVVRPKFRCRKPADPCLRVTFLKPVCTGCSEVVVLPRAVKVEGSDVREEQWAFEVDLKVWQTALDEVTMFIENLQDDPLAQWRDASDEAKFQQVQVNVVRPECLLWDHGASKWSTTTCSNGRLVENDRLLCSCEEIYGNLLEKLPVLLTGGLIILPNFINFEDYASILGRLQTNPYIALAIAIWWFVFIPAFRWARRKDKQDFRKRHFQIPEDSDPNDEHLYEVVVYTGLLRNAGTTANVTLSLEGDTGAVSDLHVISNEDKTLLQRGSIDTFLVTSNANLGNVTTVRLWHDNTGPAPSWYLNRVAVYNLRSTAPPSLFLANSWLSLDIVPFLCQIELHESILADLASFKTLLKMSLINQFRTTNVWFAPFNRVACSSFTRQQRVACLMVAVFSCMLASIMFFDTGSSRYKLSAGYVTFDFSPVIAAAEAALLLAPVNIFVNFIFRNLQPNELSDDLKPKVVEEQISPETDIPKAIPRKMTITKKPYIVDNTDLKGQIIQFFEFPLPSAKPPVRNKWDKSFSKKCRIELDSDEYCSHSYKQILADLKEIREIALNISGKRYDYISDTSSEVDALEYHDDIFAPHPAVGRRTKNLDVKQTTPENLSFDDIPFQTGGSISSGTSSSGYSVAPRSRRFRLPRWCSAFAWVAVFLHLITCSAFTVLYGLQYGNDKFQNWLFAFLLSIIQNMMVVTPLRIICIAVFFAYTRKGVVNLKDWQGFEGEEIRQDAIVRWREIQKTQKHSSLNTGREKHGHSRYFSSHPVPKRAAEIDKLPWCYVRPTFERLAKAGRLKVAVTQVRRYWMEVFLWFVIISISTTIIMLRRDWRIDHLDRHVNTHFLEDFETVKRGPDLLDFLENSLVPQLYGVNDGTRLPHEFRLLGPIRMRQVRLHPVKCHKKYNIPYKQRCKFPEDDVKHAWQYDSQHYKPHWRKSDEVYNLSQHQATPWEYVNLEELYKTNLLSGNPLRRSYYPHGGYVIDLGYTNEDVAQSLRSLRNAVWIDARTAAVFIQFSIQTPNLRCITSVILVVELLAEGSVSLHKETNTYRPAYLYSKLDLFVALLQACHLITSVWLLIDVLLQCKSVRWKRRAVFLILIETWNWLCYVIVGMTVAAYVMFYHSVSTGMAVSKNYKLDPGSFAPLSTPAYYTSSYMLLISLSTFFSHIRLLKIFRGSQLVSVIIGTFRNARLELLSVTLVTGIIIMAFMHSGAICFQQRIEFKTTVFSFMTLFSLIGGMDVNHPEVGVIDNLLWVVYFMLFMTLVIAVFVNLYAAVIDDAYREMRQIAVSRNWYPVETLAVAWLYERVLSMFGVVSTRFNDTYANARIGTVQDAMSHISLHSVHSQGRNEDRNHLSPLRIYSNHK